MGPVHCGILEISDFFHMHRLYIHVDTVIIQVRYFGRITHW